ncbi:MAG: methylmalonyl Co-A mutase-associated GTPase MeaB [Saprospiraceae bacterium]|nr:methylmalonyl Co-A mutase-associated GTPase MeaB [Saprospiraceae bacterium]
MRRTIPSTDTLVQGIRSGDRVMLGRAITLVESTLPEHTERAQEVVNHLLEQSDARPTLRIGITGAPGVGKSTLIEALGLYLIRQGHRVAVLAIDPSSAVSKGSILGDKTRMERLSTEPNAFIRPSPSGESLGGVARKTRETILLVEAAGYDIVLIETVGVGQSEIAVHSMTDLFLLLLLPGAGDELQGIKRGIVEMADLLAVNKADGDRLRLARQARAHYLNAVHLLPAKPSGYAPQVLECSAEQGTGIPELWLAMETYRQQVTENGFLVKNRRQQAAYWFKEALQEGLQSLFFQQAEIKEKLAALEPLIQEGKVSPFSAAHDLLQIFMLKKM